MGPLMSKLDNSPMYIQSMVYDPSVYLYSMSRMSIYVPGLRDLVKKDLFSSKRRLFIGEIMGPAIESEDFLDRALGKLEGLENSPS